MVLREAPGMMPPHNDTSNPATSNAAQTSVAQNHEQSVDQMPSLSRVDTWELSDSDSDDSATSGNKPPALGFDNRSQNPWEEELVERQNHQSPNLRQQSHELGVHGTNGVMTHTSTAQTYQGENKNGHGAWETNDVHPQFQSNNPFLRASNQSSDPGENGNGPQPNSWNADRSLSNQTTGIVSMTAQLSLLDQPEDPLGQNGERRLGSDPATHSASQNFPRQSASDLLVFDETPETHPQAAQTAPPSDPPALPPREPPQPAVSQQPAPAPSLPPLTGEELRKFQEKQAETYAIRHINWRDPNGVLRNSPVLVQNKNGPCPLLALVNGLVMRSYTDPPSPIVKALQTRENISLGLLIQALFDELTTYHDADQELPDIEALSRFLTMLHTGMNVNPRLTLESPNAVGSFLETNDLKLYSTFKIPLVHGWIAAPSSEAHKAMSRVAQYHEDIQLLQFRKEELEDRVIHQNATLTPEEQQLIRDIDTIDAFVNVENATQLSAFGLEHLTKTLAPGSVSILFRNDHFSTLYKHPESHQLFTLITDAGYADHAEIVWESLVDANGMYSEFFAGDFLPVSHNHHPAPHPPPRPPRPLSATAHPVTATPEEQMDADYAYALSLQYQEEEQRNRDRDRSRRPVPQTPPRMPPRPTSMPGGSSSFRGGRRPPPAQSSLVPDRRSSRLSADPVVGLNDDDVPPPSYEQVERSKAEETLRQQHARMSSSASAHSDYYSYGGARPHHHHHHRRQQYYPGAGAGMGRPQQPHQHWAATGGTSPERKDKKDCIVM